MFQDNQTQEAHGQTDPTISLLLKTLLVALQSYADQIGQRGIEGEGLATHALRSDKTRTCEPTGDYAVVSIKRGSKISGFSTRQLSRLIYQGRIPNYGSKTRPRIAIGDLPRKAGLARSA